MNLSLNVHRNIIILISFAMINFNLIAQPAKVVRVRNGKDATKSISAKDRYQFSDFLYGKLYYTNGKFAQARLNYDYLMGEVMYIDPKGDTLLIADNNMVSHAEIGKSIFHADPGNGYMEIIEKSGNIMLAKKIQYKVGGAEKKGAYNSKNDQGTISNATNYTDPNTGLSTVLPVNNTVLLKPVNFYYLIDANNRSYKPDKKSLMKIFSKNKEAVEKYLNHEIIDFNKEEDLKKAIRYCSELEFIKS